MILASLICLSRRDRKLEDPVMYDPKNRHFYRTAEVRALLDQMQMGKRSARNKISQYQHVADHPFSNFGVPMQG
jgi:hypothetical protein